MLILILIVAGIMLLSTLLAYILPPPNDGCTSRAVLDYQYEQWRKRKPLKHVFKDLLKRIHFQNKS